MVASIVSQGSIISTVSHAAPVRGKLSKFSLLTLQGVFQFSRPATSKLILVPIMFAYLALFIKNCHTVNLQPQRPQPL